MSDKRVVLDSSALVAAVKDEPGGDFVRTYIAELPQGNVHIHSVNTCEVAYQLIKFGLMEIMAYSLANHPRVELCDVIQPGLWQRAASLKAKYKNFALGDCICVAFAESLNASILTGDRHFKTIDTPVKVELFR